MNLDKDLAGSRLQRELDQRYQRIPGRLKSAEFKDREAEIIEAIENKSADRAKVLQDTADKLGVKVEKLMNRKRWVK